MMSWMSLLFEVFLASLMVALIVYCIKLNRRLSLLRDQNAKFAEMISGLGDASQRAEQAVQHLKAAGLAAEKSLRSVIVDASVARNDLSRLLAKSSQSAASPAAAAQQRQDPLAQSTPSAGEAAEERRPEKVQRDMLMGKPSGSSDQAEPPPKRPETREEAEETVLQAIRSARVGA